MSIDEIKAGLRVCAIVGYDTSYEPIINEGMVTGVDNRDIHVSVQSNDSNESESYTLRPKDIVGII